MIRRVSGLAASFLLATLPWSQLMSLRREIGVAFQRGALFSALSVGDNVALPLRENTRLDESTIPADVQPLELRAVGLYAVQPIWSDGHTSGIYTFNHLRTLAGLDEKASLAK